MITGNIIKFIATVLVVTATINVIVGDYTTALYFAIASGAGWSLYFGIRILFLVQGLVGLLISWEERLVEAQHIVSMQAFKSPEQVASERKEAEND